MKTSNSIIRKLYYSTSSLKVTKFKILKKDPTEKLEAKVNSLIQTLHMTIEPSKSLPKQTGHFTPAYMYGNPKVHKESTPNLNLKPTIYCRYVDDIFVLAKDLDQVFKLRHSLISSFVLNFTYELEKSKRLNFLDLTVTRGSNGLKTSVNIKRSKKRCNSVMDINFGRLARRFIETLCDSGTEANG